LFAVQILGQVGRGQAIGSLHIAIIIFVVLAAAIEVLLIVWQSHAEALVHLASTCCFLKIGLGTAQSWHLLATSQPSSICTAHFRPLAFISTAEPFDDAPAPMLSAQ
jgi:hypothetical protein